MRWPHGWAPSRPVGHSGTPRSSPTRGQSDHAGPMQQADAVHQDALPLVANPVLSASELADSAAAATDPVVLPPRISYPRGPKLTLEPAILSDGAHGAVGHCIAGVAGRVVLGDGQASLVMPHLRQSFQHSNLGADGGTCRCWATALRLPEAHGAASDIR
jgi:hypothetical protein